MRIVAIGDMVGRIRSKIANAYIDFSQMTAWVVAVVTDLKVEGKPVVGYGFNSNGRYAQHGLLNERFINRLSGAKADSLLDAEGLLDPAQCWKAMMANEKPGGHGEPSVAVGELDTALGDGVAGAVKGKYDLPTAIEFGKAIEGFGLGWYEEPLEPLDYLAHAALATQYAPPLATGENLFSMQDARNLIRHGGLRPDRDILQFDPALSYGLVEYLRTLDMLKANGWSPRRPVPQTARQVAPKRARAR